MNPALTLALLAIVAVLAARLPHIPLPSGLDWLRRGPLPLVLLGGIVGPFAGAIDQTTFHAVSPVVALAVGWLGAHEGIRLEGRLLRHIPRTVWLETLGPAALGFVAAASAAWLVGRFVPAWDASLGPRLPVSLAIGCVTAATAATAVGPQARALRHVALLETGFATVAALFALAFVRPHAHFAGSGGLLAWITAGAGAAWVSGRVFAALRGFTRQPGGQALALLGFIALASGIGYTTGCSPFVLCAALTAVIVNTVHDRNRIRSWVVRGSRLAAPLVFIAVGALMRIPTWWIIPGVLAISVVRAGVRLAATRWLRVGGTNVSQDGVALALGVNFLLCAGATIAWSSAFATVVVLLVALSRGTAPLLAHLGSKPAWLTPSDVAAELKC